MKNNWYCSSCHPEMKIWMCGKPITVKNWRNLTISKPKLDFHNINAHTVWWKSIDIYLLSSSKENTDVGRQITVKNWRNLPISNPKPDLHNINAYTKFGENPLTFTQVMVWKQNMHEWIDRRPTWNCNALPLLYDGIWKELHRSLCHTCIL